jgi:hypothetical protein
MATGEKEKSSPQAGATKRKKIKKGKKRITIKSITE